MRIIIDGLFGTATAFAFTMAISLVFALSIVALLSDRKQEKRVWIVSRAPGLLTSLGLFGTFWGAAVGLGGFDSRNIDASIPVLLEGLKLAFWTSILGMFYAAFINLTHYLMKIYSPVSETRASIPDIGNAIEKFSAAVEESAKSLNESAGLVKRLAGSLGTFAASVEKSADSQARHIQNITLNLEAILKQGMQNVESTFNNANAAIGRTITNRMEQLEYHTQLALAEALQTMANNLASIDEKLIEDISTITHRLEALSEASRKAGRP